jgi:hypothetical protein
METVPGRSQSAAASATVDTMILSEQILFPVLLTLGLQDCFSLARACCACKTFNEIGSENLIWRAVCEKEWPELGIESIEPLVEVLGGHKKLYWLLQDRHSSFLSAAPVYKPSSWTDAVFCFLLTSDGEAQGFSIVDLSTYKKGLVTNEGHASDVPSVGRLPFSLIGKFQPVEHNDPVEGQRNRSPCRGSAIFLYKSSDGGLVTSPMWTRTLVGAVVCKKSGRVARLLDQHDIKFEITERDTSNDGRQVVTGIKIPFAPKLFERKNAVETRTWFEYYAMGEGFSGAEQVVEAQRLREAAGSRPLDQTSRHVPLAFKAPPEADTRYLPWKSVLGFVLRGAVTGRCGTRVAESGTLAESLVSGGFCAPSGLEQEIVNFEPQRVEFSVSLLTNVPYYASESAGKDPSNFSEAPGRVTFQGVEDCLLALLDWK